VSPKGTHGPRNFVPFQVLDAKITRPPEPYSAEIHCINPYGFISKKQEAETSRALKGATITYVLGGRLTEYFGSFSCIAVLFIPADYFAVSLALSKLLTSKSTSGVQPISTS